MPAVSRFHFERELLAAGCTRIAGVDEAGRGPLAGPVVAAAVIFPADWIRDGLPGELKGLNDSKQLTEPQRDAFFEFLVQQEVVAFGIAGVDHVTIDRINILRATHRAMQDAVAKLSAPPAHLLVDGRPVPELGAHQTALVKGDARSYSIAAASVLAKVTRDRLMLDYDRQFPAYGFAGHKGYGTAGHLAALAAFGPCAIHRRSFAPIRKPEPEFFPNEPLAATQVRAHQG
ncbi:MAG: ribonuclease HII [Verrucomicrobia bacterium]|nr:ribonuclease HII [Verrucomicrobiota bacterium]